MANMLIVGANLLRVVLVTTSGQRLINASRKCGNRVNEEEIIQTF